MTSPETPPPWRPVGAWRTRPPVRRPRERRATNRGGWIWRRAPQKVRHLVVAARPSSVVRSRSPPCPKTRDGRSLWAHGPATLRVAAGGGRRAARFSRSSGVGRDGARTAGIQILPALAPTRPSVLGTGKWPDARQSAVFQEEPDPNNGGIVTGRSPQLQSTCNQFLWVRLCEPISLDGRRQDAPSCVMVPPGSVGSQQVPPDTHRPGAGH